MEVHFLEISYNTKYYKEACRLRDDILRKPLGMSLYDQNLEEEKDHIHIIGKSFEDDVIAYLQFKIIDEKSAKMQQVVVSQQHQSKGIGKELINFSEKFMSTKGLNNILLHAREPVIGFYERLGYEKFGEKFLEVTIPHYKMKKRIRIKYENTDDFHSLFSWRFFISGQNTCNRTTERMVSSSKNREKPHNR